MTLSLFVPGKPAPQGSKRHVGKGVMVESSKSLKPWRESIRWAVLAERREPDLKTGPVGVLLTFVMPRPTSTPKRRTPPAVKRPDIDKLARALLDALGSAGVWTDDSQVTDLWATKRLAEIGETPGVHITVRSLTEEIP